MIKKEEPERRGRDFKSTKRSQISLEEAKFLIDSRYQIKEVLGKGSYGTVCSAVDLGIDGNEEGIQLAIKKVSNIFDKQVLLKRAVRELKLMKHFKGHRNVTITPHQLSFYHIY